MTNSRKNRIEESALTSLRCVHCENYLNVHCENYLNEGENGLCDLGFDLNPEWCHGHYKDIEGRKVKA